MAASIRSIVSEYLTREGYDGLYIEDRCACLNDKDFMPCSVPNENCEPGYKLPGDGDYDYYVGPKKKNGRTQ